MFILIKFFYSERSEAVNRIEAVPGVWLLREKALWLPELSAVVIADVHLGYESGLFDEPFYPKMQFRDVAERMEKLMKRYSPERVIIDGDLKHEFSSMPYPEFSEVREFLDIVENAEVTLIRGNHDNFVIGYMKKRGVGVLDSLSLGRFFFVHGHKNVEIPEGKMAIIGHEHPVMRIRDAVGGSASFPCFILYQNVLVLPAFSEISGGSDALRGNFLSPILSDYEPENARIFAISDEGVVGYP